MLSMIFHEGNQAIHQNIDSKYILCMDSHKGGVVKLKGKINKLMTIIEDVYVSVVEWSWEHVEIIVSQLIKHEIDYWYKLFIQLEIDFIH